MTANNLIKELLEILSLQGISQRGLASKAGLSPSVVTHLLNGARPEASTLAAIIFHATDQEDLRQGLVIAHLKDEVIRAGHKPAGFHLGVAAEVSELQKINSILSLHKGLAAVILAAEQVPALMATLNDLAELVEHYEEAPKPKPADLAKAATAQIAEKRRPSPPPAQAAKQA